MQQRLLRIAELERVTSNALRLRVLSKDDSNVARFMRMRQRTPPPPIVVKRTLEGYEILDGLHRVAAAKACGEEMILADIQGDTTAP